MSTSHHDTKGVTKMNHTEHPVEKSREGRRKGRMSIGRSRTRRVAVLALAVAMIAGGAIWAISASARVSPIKDSFQASGTISFAPEGYPYGLAAASCTLTASGTLPASGSVITATTLTFTKCEGEVEKGGSFSFVAKGPWTFTLAWGLPATVKVSIPSEGIVATIVKGHNGSCKWTNEAFTSGAETWENGVSEKEKETEGAVFTKSESVLVNEVIPGKYASLEKEACGLPASAKVQVSATHFTWEDLTHTKQAILNGN